MKITAISPTERGGYTGRYGYMFTYNVTLDDGTSGEVSCQKENTWKVGDEVELTSSESNQFGTKLRLAKPNSGGVGFGGWKSDPDKQHRIDASWAISNAIAMGRTDSVAIKQYAKALITLRDEIAAESAKPEPSPLPEPVTTQIADTTDVPF